MLSCESKPALFSPALIILSIMFLLPISGAHAQEAGSDQAARALAETDVTKIDKDLQDVQIKIRMADRLAATVAGKEGFELQIVQSRISKLLSESLEITIKLAQTLGLDKF